MSINFVTAIEIRCDLCDGHVAYTSAAPGWLARNQPRHLDKCEDCCLRELEQMQADGYPPAGKP